MGKHKYATKKKPEQNKLSFEKYLNIINKVILPKEKHHSSHIIVERKFIRASISLNLRHKRVILYPNWFIKACTLSLHIRGFYIQESITS